MRCRQTGSLFIRRDIAIRRRQLASNSNVSKYRFDRGGADHCRRSPGVLRVPATRSSRHRKYCGGYCYLNNNSLAAQSLLDEGAARVAILDVDYHHGNGTQSIFYERDDVLTISLHADPKVEYPFFLGYADEPGSGQGHGFNVNYPLPFGTAWDSYRGALADALDKVRKFSPDALVVALGLDTFAGDPTTFFEITTDDFSRMGAAISSLELPTLVVLEGGYSVDWIGENTVKFLGGLESG